MEFLVNLSSISDLKDFVNAAGDIGANVEVRSTSHNYIVDASSLLGVMSLDLAKPVKVVTEDEESGNRLKAQVEKCVVE